MKQPDTVARILKGIDEMNQVPVIFRWKKFDIGVA